MTGEIASLPANRAWMDEWTAPFEVEIWVSNSSGSGPGVASASLNLDYNTAYFTAISVEFGPAFRNAGDLTSSIDDATGRVQLGGSTTVADAGDNRPALLARIRFDATANDPGVDLVFDGSYVQPVDDLGFRVDAPQVELTGINPVTPEVGPLPDTELWPVMYDFDDDNRIFFSDFSYFVVDFQALVGSPGADVCGRRRRRSQWPAVLQRFRLVRPQFRQGQDRRGGPRLRPQLPRGLAGRPAAFGGCGTGRDAPATERVAAPAPLTPEQLAPVAQAVLEPSQPAADAAAVGRRGVTLQIVDLPGNLLGQAQGNTIQIDVDAAGQGWFVDATPWDNSEFVAAGNGSGLAAVSGSAAAGRVDLLTVILHELGHLAGLKHAAEGRDGRNAVGRHAAAAARRPGRLARRPRHRRICCKANRWTRMPSTRHSPT